MDERSSLAMKYIERLLGKCSITIKKSCETSLHIKTTFVVISSTIVLLQNKNKNCVLSNVTVL